MPRKAPRRTAERILDAALDLFNRFGEPNVSTSTVAADLGISPGNLHYHYPAKAELVNALFERYAQSLQPLWPAAREVADVEDAWFILHTMFEKLWDFRFLYRDINDLLSRNRHLEAAIGQILQDKTQAIGALIDGLRRADHLQMQDAQVQATARSMVVVLCWWLSFEYARDPRHALEGEQAGHSLMRGAYQVLHLLVPYLAPGQRDHLMALASAYGPSGDAAHRPAGVRRGSGGTSPP